MLIGLFQQTTIGCDPPVPDPTTGGQVLPPGPLTGKLRLHFPRVSGRIGLGTPHYRSGLLKQPDKHKVTCERTSPVQENLE